MSRVAYNFFEDFLNNRDSFIIDTMLTDADRIMRMVSIVENSALINRLLRRIDQDFETVNRLITWSHLDATYGKRYEKLRKIYKDQIRYQIPVDGKQK